MSMSGVLESPEATRKFGAMLATALPDGTVVAMLGELGAGKTALVQGAAEGIGAVMRDGDDEDGALSPTFVLVREYDSNSGRRIVHVDAHRLTSGAELTDIGGDDFLGADNISFVEWADRVESALPRPYLAISLSHHGETSRRMEIDGVGERADALVDVAFKALVQAGCAVERA